MYVAWSNGFIWGLSRKQNCLHNTLMQVNASLWWKLFCQSSREFYDYILIGIVFTGFTLNKTTEKSATCSVLAVTLFSLKAYIPIWQKYTANLLLCINNMYWMKIMCKNYGVCSIKAKPTFTMINAKSTSLFCREELNDQIDGHQIELPLTLHELGEKFPVMSLMFMHEIVTVHLNYRKLCAWWAPWN